MIKRKTSAGCELTLDGIERVNLDKKKLKGLQEFKPEIFFQDPAQVQEALVQCLNENDIQAFNEILDSYLRVNHSKKG